MLVQVAAITPQWFHSAGCVKWANITFPGELCGVAPQLQKAAVGPRALLLVLSGCWGEAVVG